MSSHEDASAIPQFVFICGAVGSGNSFLFTSIMQDSNVYGINEDGMGSTLRRLLESNHNGGYCPHSVDAFVQFMQMLRGERRTLVLKTPSNIREIRTLRKYLPQSRFIITIREPHAAIVSGLSRHGAAVEKVARLWLSDYEHHGEMESHGSAITFEELVNDPVEVLRRISDNIVPLCDDVFTYARRMSRQERADPERWLTKVDSATAADIKHWVQKLDAERVYQRIGQYEAATRGTQQRGSSTRVGALFRLWMNNSKHIVLRCWYRLRR